MSSTKPLDIVARFRTVTTEFNTSQVVNEIEDVDAAFKASGTASDTWSRKLKANADDAATDLKTNGKGKFKEAAGEIGSEFSENIGEAFRSGDLKGSLLETFTSLGPALGVAGIAVGAGAAIINGIVQGMEANAQKVKQAMKDAYGSAVDDVFGGGGGGRTIGEVINDLTPDDIANIKRAGITVGAFAQAVSDAENGDPAKLDAISDALNRRAAAHSSVNTAVGAGKSGAGGAQGAYLAAKELAGTQEVVDLINAGNAAIRARAAALADLMEAAGKVDLERLRAVGGATNAIRRDPDYNRGRR